MSDLFSWGTARRINIASDYLKRKFGGRVQKLTIDAGFSCPNRDGSKGLGGCHFCNNSAFNPSYCSPEKSVSQQIGEGKQFHEKRYRRASEYLAYFQAYSNTYADTGTLKTLYSEALRQEGVKGLIIGTRPDCIDEEKLEYLARLSEKYYIVIEYGIETTNNMVLQAINRGHTFEDSVKALELTKKFGILSGAHFIFGLPGESREEMIGSADLISSLPLHTVKFHQLQIVRGSRFAEELRTTPSKFDLFTLDDYIGFIVRFMERLNPSFIVERLAAETQPRNNMHEIWGGLRYDSILRLIEKKMEETGTWQGKFFNKRQEGGEV